MQIRNWTKSASKLIGQMLLYPARLLFLPLRLLYLFASLFHENGINEGKLGWFASLRRLVTIPAKTTSEFAQYIYKNGKAIELLYLIPGLAILGFFLFVGYQIRFNKGAIEQRYLSGARRSISNQRPDLAKKYFQRVVEKDNLSDNLVFNWAIILQMAGDSDQGNDMLAKIASDNSAGYTPAHQAIAIQLASEVQQSKPEAALLNRLRWHLENSGEPTATIAHAWATYHVAKNQPQLAIGHLEKAATQMPRLLIALAELCEKRGLSEKRTESLQKAKQVFSDRLLENPLDQDSRILLSSVLLKLNEPIAAEDNLLSGLRIYRNPQLESEICNFYVLRFDRASKDQTKVHDSAKLSTTQKFDMLRRSLLICPKHMSTYSRLASLTTAPDTESQSKLKSDFIAMVTGEHSSALAHACLGHLEAQAGNSNEAKWHLDQAWGFDEDFGKIASKLAKAFTFHAPVDIEWALVLARQSVTYSENQEDVRMVLAEIYLEKSDFNAARDVLLWLLENGHQSTRIHELLTAAYRGLGEIEKSLHHAAQASATQNASAE